MTYALAGRVVVLTGSTGGLGRAVAMALRDKGARLALLDIDRAAVYAQVRDLGGGSDVWGGHVDVRSWPTVESAIDAAAHHFGRIDVAIANAGVATASPMEKISPEAFDRVIDINLNGAWRTFRAALPHVRQHKGYMLAVSSMAAFVHSPLQAHYTASKAGVWAMCDSIRLEVRHLGVGVGTIHPTFFATPMMDGVLADPAGVKIWGGNRGGLWKMVSLDEVVQGIIRGVERRDDMIVVPRKNMLVARAPGVFRRLVERVGFRDADIKAAIAAAGVGDR
ncbi:SDR family NAD(P)-dependent oxidoreductase [Novosphingobium capsulatum]|uniref:SDR family NAD(P)-dependent oxidoreductase n=1 Tax=Novosphingobium capsulatum TaxID=13688 RepID=UPI000786D26A|nr:SDR family NAD(P)-dependent oxidoreductase [Novosphingobium capsulatum]WQD91459.1 SDR family NAD(P)-dependent oxidoreductase [Novosphingobium capsulatum]